jgi:hypothetical protein
MAEKQELQFFNDKAGNPVQVGDYILYGQVQGMSAGLAFGKVLKIEAVVSPRCTNYTISNIGVCDGWSGLKLNSNPGTLRYPDRIINANSFIPEAYKALYKGTKYDI